jgi:hypothetical protein
MFKLSTTMIAFLSVCALGTACKKKAKESTEAAKTSEPAKTAEPAKAGEPAPAAAAAGPATCAPNAWKEPTGLFCIDATGFEAGKVEKNDDDEPEWHVYFKKPEADAMKAPVGFYIRWYLTRDNSQAALAVLNLEADAKTNPPLDKGNFSGGKGKYFIFKKDDGKSQRLRAIVEGKKHAYNCESDPYETPVAPEVLAACKSLVATD